MLDSRRISTHDWLTSINLETSARSMLSLFFSSLLSALGRCNKRGFEYPSANPQTNVASLLNHSLTTLKHP